jgi:zinc D-Ala-D-Ala carboxypeptidase
MSVNWNNSKYFKATEFTCSHTSTEKMNQDFIDKLNNLREVYGKPMTVSSGYRDSTHPVEAMKKDPKGGAHVSGKAADILIERGDAFKLLSLAFTIGFTGIGVSQKGGARFLHLDTIESSPARPRPTIWSY